MSFFTCLDEEFKVRDIVELEFNYMDKIYKTELFILPKVDKFKILLGKQELIKIFAKPKNRVCQIKTKPGEKVVERVYGLPQKLEVAIDAEIEKLLMKKYIQKSRSTWLNNLRPVMKPDGSVRVTTNLIALNKLVDLDKYSLPSIERILHNLKDQKYFSKLDLKDGFFQIELAEEDRHKTAFRHKHHLYEWNVMPMGFKNSPAIFQRFMDDVLQEDIGKRCFIYVDDILVFGTTEEIHDKNFRIITERLKNNDLRLNEDKTIYKKTSVEFLGHIIEYNKIKPKLEASQGIDEIKPPQNIKSLQEFLGFINFYREFIPMCSSVAGCLYDLLKKDKNFCWGELEDKAFNELKTIIKSNIALYQPDYAKPFILETDACNSGVGAILSQRQGETIYPISYASRRLLPAEINYSISEKECLAVLWAMENFKYFLYGNKFEVITDHKALEVLNKGEIGSQRIQRWLDRLSQNGTCRLYISLIPKDAQVVNEIQDLNDDTKRKLIKDKYEKFVHRGAKIVAKELKREYTWDNMEKLVEEELKKCIRCKMYNPKRGKAFLFVKSFYTGEKVAIDIIGPINKQYIITGIDYFSRKGFGKVITTRDSQKIVDFINEINKQILIKELIMDSSKENQSSKVKNWAIENKVKVHYTTPFHHQSNGRVERFNRTVQEGIYKQEGNLNLKSKLLKMLEAYNNICHSKLGMSPNEACKKENETKIKEKQYEEIIIFNKANENKEVEEVFNENDQVIIKNEFAVAKGQPKFKDRGQIIERLENNSYIVLSKGRRLKRHASQLKVLVY
ncbi:integrase catalytic domain-containing protein [Vairimorpha necatrix]|uniref:Integrase catalytic domain-containing protein n=1 Tax=Vairimorpha necatrix TaxID=6039 RepID=A0AAX4JFJ2_9MICR